MAQISDEHCYIIQYPCPHSLYPKKLAALVSFGSFSPQASVYYWQEDLNAHCKEKVWQKEQNSLDVNFIHELIHHVEYKK